MPATEQDMARLRRMVAEPSEDTYTDDVLQAMLDENRLADVDGVLPSDDDWIPTYDLNATAADVWAEKASSLATAYDFSADGAQYERSQQIAQASTMERKYRARRAARGVALTATHREIEDGYELP
jgi:hypothetical protein